MAAGKAKSNQFWWPDQLDLGPLRDHDANSNPLGEDFDYAEAFEKLDLQAVKEDLKELEAYQKNPLDAEELKRIDQAIDKTHAAAKRAKIKIQHEGVPGGTGTGSLQPALPPR